MSKHFDLIEKARAILTSSGLVVDTVDCSGNTARCGTTEKPHSQNGWYLFHMDFPPNIEVINYNGDGVKYHFDLFEKSELDAMTEAEKEALRDRIRQEQKEAQEKRERERQEAAERAKGIWAKCRYATAENAYLKHKGVLPMGDMMQDVGGRLVLPVVNSEGETVSLQFIAGDSEKRFLKNGEKAGCFFPIPAKDGGKSGPLLIGEGVATVLSCCMATGYAGLVAFDAGNLLPVAQMSREKYPDRVIVLCADNDLNNKKPDGSPYNPGQEKAEEAARAIGAKLAVCPSVDGKNTDFNDLHIAEGLERVRGCIEEAIQESAMFDETDEATPKNTILLPPPAPVDVLPEPLQYFVLHAAEAFQVPTSFPLCILLNICGSLVGATRHIQLKPQWGAYPTLPLVLVAPSGVGKSTVTNYLQKAFLSRIEQRLAEQFAIESEEYEVALDQWQEDRIGPKPEPPKQGCLVLDDATEEAIGEALFNNPRGVNIVSDEVASFICGMGRYNGAREASKTRLISCLDGSLWKNSRKGKKACIVPNALLSLLGGVQPKRFKEIFTEDFFDSGLAQRVTFIRAVREKPAKWKRARISDREEEELFALLEYLYALEFDTSPDGLLIPFKVQLSDEAEATIGEYYDSINEEAFLAQNSDAEASRLTKTFTKLSAVALLLHILDCHYAGKTDYHVKISADVIRRAILFNQWANAHERQIYQYCETQNAKAVTPPDLALMKAIIQLAECGQYVQQSDGSKFFANSDMLEAVNRELQDIGGEYTSATLARNQLLKPCTPIKINRHKRGRKIPDELLAQYKLTVSSVSSVSNRCGTRDCGERHSKNNCLQVSPEEQGMIQDGRQWRQSKNPVSPLKTVAAQGLETLETVETLLSDVVEF